MARLHRLGRAHSHEGVTQGYHYHTDPDTDHGKYRVYLYLLFFMIITCYCSHIDDNTEDNETCEVHVTTTSTLCDLDSVIVMV